MANKRGQLNCLTKTRNTGFGACVLDWKQITGAFIFDSPRSFSDLQISMLMISLLAAAADDNKSTRMYPVHNFVAPTDSSEKVIIETFDYGGKNPVRDGDFDWTFQYVDGAQCLQNALRTHNGKRWVLFYDKDNKLMGYNKNGVFSAIPLQFFYAHPFSLATGSKSAAYLVQFVFLAKYGMEESDFVQADFDLGEITGLQDIDIILNSFNQDTGVANVTLQAACGAENIYDLFHGQIADTSLSAVDQDGNIVSVSSVFPQPGSKSFAVTLLNTDLPDNGTVTLSGALVSVLAGQHIEGYEIGSLDLEVVGSS